MNITGHHHISIYTKNKTENKAFYTDLLGLSLVEETVNQDDPSMYHVFYGDDAGSPGTMLTFFEIQNIGRHHPGTDSVYSVSFLVPDDAALMFFKERLLNAGIFVQSLKYLNQNAVQFKDPDELNVLLISNGDFKLPLTPRHATSDIPKDYQITMLGPIMIKVNDMTPTVNFLRETLNYKKREDVDEVIMAQDDTGLYTDIMIIEEKGEKEKPGRGYVHHIALSTPDDNTLDEILNVIEEHGESSGIIDRYFFKSLYYRENHIMYEFATEVPGFTMDTPVHERGKKLMLPDFLEKRREEIERNLNDR